MLAEERTRSSLTAAFATYLEKRQSLPEMEPQDHLFQAFVLWTRPGGGVLMGRMRRWGIRQSGWWLLVTVAVGLSAASWLARVLPGVVGGALIAVAATVGAALSQRGQQLIDDSRRQVLEIRDKLLRDRRGRIPGVRDIDDLTRIGVHPAAPEENARTIDPKLPPFVRRDRSTEIEEALRTHPFVLVVGESTAGKTRAAFEAAREVLPRAALIVPDPADPTALRAAAAALPGGHGSVVWLDDIERYLGAGGLTPRLLDRLTRPGAVVLATIRAQERARYQGLPGPVQEGPEGSVRRFGRDVLAIAYEIRLDRRWNEREVTRAREFSQDKRLARAIGGAERYGIAEFLAAGPELLRAWQDAWAPEGRHVRGAALVGAAVDASRAGWSRPLPTALLRDLHELHLAERGGLRLHPEGWEEALAWAATAVHATSSMLTPADSAEDGYYVFDYLPDSMDAVPESTPVLDGTWAVLIAAADAEVCEDIGRAALTRAQRTAARDAFQKASDGGVLTAAAGLALLLGDEWRLAEACEVLRTTLQSAPPDTDPEVLFTLRSALAWWTGGAGNVEEALELVTRLYEDVRQRYGDDHAQTFEAALDVARWTGHAGRTSEALRLALATQTRSLRVLGPEHLTTLNSRFEVAGGTFDSGRTTEAVRLWGELADDAGRLLGTHHRLTVYARWNQAGAVTTAGDTALGLRLLAEVVEGWAAIHGVDHPRTLSGRLQLTGWTGTAGRWGEALALLASVVEDTARALGPDHELTLAGRHQQALWTGCSGRSDEANTAFRALLDDCERHLGADHPLTEHCRAHHARPGQEAWYYLPPSW
ncbi:tetratricopeptide repeat protein [Streptomyces sp. HUAS ZL42]|uniref:tetratricopeptide repeat protein n=1 Tax=Streptomyces sp. HUAS ZL42 TaxID=3231715 RepID=UPI00345E0B3F